MFRSRLIKWKWVNSLCAVQNELDLPIKVSFGNLGKCLVLHSFNYICDDFRNCVVCCGWICYWLTVMSMTYRWNLFCWVIESSSRSLTENNCTLSINSSFFIVFLTLCMLSIFFWITVYMAIVFRDIEAEDSMEKLVHRTNCCWAWWSVCGRRPKHKYVHFHDRHGQLTLLTYLLTYLLS